MRVPFEGGNPSNGRPFWWRCNLHLSTDLIDLSLQNTKQTKHLRIDSSSSVMTGEALSRLKASQKIGKKMWQLVDIPYFSHVTYHCDQAIKLIFWSNLISFVLSSLWCQELSHWCLMVQYLLRCWDPQGIEDVQWLCTGFVRIALSENAVSTSWYQWFGMFEWTSISQIV